jgi:sugar fermentation stimulation protein A
MQIKWNSTIMIFKDRKKRFLGYMTYKQKEQLVYCCNSGKMADILIPGSECIVTSKNVGIEYEWQAIKIDGEWIGVNTSNPNKLIRILLTKLFPDETFVPEKTFGSYRCDFASDKTIIEVKNVHWKVNDIAYFPDCITTRGSKQMKILADLAKTYNCYVIYVVQRKDVQIMKVADFIDPEYFKNSKLAEKNGLKVMAFNCIINEEGISINQQIKVIDI